MFMEERHQEISDIIQTNGKITISEITEKYGISDESARRDLRMLEGKGICQRTHGGAIVPRQVGVRPPANRDFENMTVYDNYREISRVAVNMIKENDTVYLTSGSFGHIMISLLPREFHFTVAVRNHDTDDTSTEVGDANFHARVILQRVEGGDFSIDGVRELLGIESAERGFHGGWLLLITSCHEYNGCCHRNKTFHDSLHDCECC